VVPVRRALEEWGEGPEQVAAVWVRLDHDHVRPGVAHAIGVALARGLGGHRGRGAGKNPAGDGQVEGALEHGGDAGAVVGVAREMLPGREPGLHHVEAVQLHRAEHRAAHRHRD
jgi:hypothetical protein